MIRQFKSRVFGVAALSTEAPQITDDRTSASANPRRRALARLRVRLRNWRAGAKRVAGVIAAVAAVGAVLGGLAGFWSAYKVVIGEWLGTKPPMVTQTTAEPAAPAFNPPRLSIAVLPFENLNGDASQDYFADGIVENLTTDLSVNIANLLVIARGSSFTYKGQKIDPKRVGRELNVRYLLQGAVQRNGRDVRINARLIDVESGEQVWADRLDGDTGDLAALQDQMTARISNSLRWAFLSVGNKQARKRSNPDALDLMLKAQSTLFDERRVAINPRRGAEEYYRKALAIEPDNAEVCIGLALVLAENLSNSRSLAPANRPTTTAAAATKVEIEELLRRASLTQVLSSDAHFARAYVYGYEQRFADAVREFERARVINPNNTPSLSNLGLAYVFMGEQEKAVKIFEEIFARTAGKGPAYRISLTSWAGAYSAMGNYAAAIEKYEQAQAMRAEPVINMRMAAAHAQIGDMDAARRQFEIWQSSRPSALSIKQLRDTFMLYSVEPRYLRQLDATLFEGLRKLGVPEE